MEKSELRHNEHTPYLARCYSRREIERLRFWRMVGDILDVLAHVAMLLGTFTLLWFTLVLFFSL